MVTITNMNNIRLFLCDISQKYTTVVTKQAYVPYFWHTAKVHVMCIKPLYESAFDCCTQHKQNPLIHLRCITTNTKSVTDLHENYAPRIRWPTIDERQSFAGFEGFEQAVGAIDGTSHEIQVSINEPQPNYYRVHRKYHCIRTQVLLNGHKKVVFLMSGFEVSQNDAQTYMQLKPIGLKSGPGFPQAIS